VHTMSTIKFFALGGLGENGKNMYCLELENKLFILDAGLKYPSTELFGVDSIIPDFTYLEENKHKIVGLFLSHGHEDHIGAVPRLLKTMDTLPIYGSHFTLEILKDALKDQEMDESCCQFNEVDSSKVLRFDDITVEFYRVTHSIPESLGIAITTKDGVIVYAPDYNFDQNVDNIYKTEFTKLAEIAGKNVLALLTESLGAERAGYTHSSTALDHALEHAFSNAEGRIIVSAFSTDLLRIQKIIDVALDHNRKIAIIGRKTQRIIDIAVTLGYLKIPQESLVGLKFIDEKNKNELRDSIVLVAGERHEPFYMLQRMVKKLDRLIHINSDDTIIMMTPPVPGTEKIAARTMDILYRNDTNVVKISKSELPPSHASSEDIKLLINILNPKFIVPVIGEYRHQYALRELCSQLGYEDNKVIMLDNGQILEFRDGDLLHTKNKVESGEIFVDGILDGDVSDVVLRDRELLSEDGVLLIIANVDARRRVILSEPEIVSRGFVYMKENEDLIENVRNIFLESSKRMFSGKYIDWRKYKDDVRDSISKYLYKEIKRRPIIIPVLVDTQLK